MQDLPFIVSPGTVFIEPDIEKYPGGIVIPLDKPYRWTSADAIRKIKFAASRFFHKKNLKVGHAGTLDPLATGILIVCIGNATKSAQSLQDEKKEYVAGISFGATTPSYDLEKEVDQTYPHGHITEEGVRKALEGFIGEQEQVAPLFSAKSVDGVRAYELARKMYRKASGSADIDQAAKELLRTSIISIDRAELLSFVPGGDGMCQAAPGGDIIQADPSDEAASLGEGSTSKASGRINVADTSALGLPRADVIIACSKGTYIRAFARDLGEALSSGAHLHSLRRTKNGAFSIEDSVSLSKALALLSPIKD